MAKNSKWYSIDRPNESAEYLQGWAIAGKYLQALFNQYNRNLENEYTGFCWLRTQITSPTFDSMNFRFKNNIFSVLVDFISDGHSYMSPNCRSLQIKVCAANDIIPCRFTISTDNMMPFESGWNLRHTQTGKMIIPTEISDDSLRPVSDWELLNWAITIVMSDLQKNGNKILSFTDAPDVMPQLWFEDESGNRCWVQVIVKKPMSIANFSGTSAEKYTGYIAEVSIMPADGEPILYRSHLAVVDYQGLQKVR